MRFLVSLLMSLSILAWTPSLSLAQDVAAASEAQLASEHAMAPATADESPPLLTMHEIVVGTAVLGGVFAVGLLAGGSLSTGIAAASAVVLVYAFMP